MNNYILVYVSRVVSVNNFIYVEPLFVYNLNKKEWFLENYGKSLESYTDFESEVIKGEFYGETKTRTKAKSY